MNTKFDITGGQNKDFLNFCGWVSTLPIIGLGISVFLLLFRMIRNSQWSLQLLCITIAPFLVLIFLHAVIAIIVKRKFDLRIRLVPQKWGAVFLVLIILYVTLNFIIRHNNQTVELPTINISEINTVSIESNEKSNGKYYLVFGSQNCIYCHQMEQIYKDIHKCYSDIVLYYVDLTYEPLSNPKVKDHNITSMPSMVCYQNDAEVDRIEGLASYDMLVTFVDQMEGGR